MSSRDFDQMVRKAQRMEKRVEEVKKELKKRVFEGKAEGLVEANVNGDHQVLSLKISPEVINPDDPARLEDLILQALNDALTKSKIVIDAEMRRATKGFSVPGM